MKQQVNLEIMQFVETQILPKYTEFGESHGLRHVTRVIRNALKGQKLLAQGLQPVLEPHAKLQSVIVFCFLSRRIFYQTPF